MPRASRPFLAILPGVGTPWLTGIRVNRALAGLRTTMRHTRHPDAAYGRARLTGRETPGTAPADRVLLGQQVAAAGPTRQSVERTVTTTLPPPTPHQTEPSVADILPRTG
ncbi:hypothetical protein NDU88_003837 [Pleurodeles waltl]|uniref:Uncharacterized protein n=1 Tax=Pleurodeles waltl TaxID=8319 RepID=A0AAV7V1T6_PLEWA|nr:hypothetical protein NDU88_003837 [Pleurodeles waltl]